MKVNVLATGSKGNATIIQSGATTLLLDAGISGKCIVSRLTHPDTFDHIQAIFITHEHSDHVKFLGTLAKRLNVPIYITKKSLKALAPNIKEYLYDVSINLIEAKKTYTFGDFDISTFNLMHDSADILGYYFYSTTEHKSIAYAADTGVFPESLLPLFKEAEIVMLEANHNVEILNASNRDYYVKQRALSATGHLNNSQCLDVLKRINNPQLKVVILLHKSEECNTVEAIMADTVNPFKKIFSGDVYIGYQNEPTGIIEV